MLPLGAGEIAQMRTVAAVTFAGTAVIHAATKTDDGQGGEVWAYVASGTVGCHFSPEQLRGGEQSMAERLAEVQPYILTVPHSTTIDADDRVIVSSVTYEVSEVLDNRTWQLTKRVRVFEVD